jgi:hypothetical protein
VDLADYDLVVLPDTLGRSLLSLDPLAARMMRECIASGRALAPACRDGQIDLSSCTPCRHVPPHATLRDRVGRVPRPCGRTTFWPHDHRMAAWRCPDRLPVACRTEFRVLRNFCGVANAPCRTVAEAFPPSRYDLLETCPA